MVNFSLKSYRGVLHKSIALSIVAIVYMADENIDIIENISRFSIVDI